MSHTAFAGVAGFSLQILGAAAMVIWPEKLWIAYSMLIGGSLLLIGSIILWLRTNFRFQWPLLKPSEDKLIQLKDLFNEAKRLGWDFGLSSLQLIDLIKGLRQEGVNGNLVFHGKDMDKKLEGLIRDEPLIGIQPDHWKEFDIIVDALSYDLLKDNYYVRSQKLGVYGFADLHVERYTAIKWLKKDAIKWRGKTTM